MPDSGFVITGYTESYPPYEPAALVIRLNSSGNVLWAKKYAEPVFGFRNGNDILITGDGFLCYFDEVDFFYLVSMDWNGEVKWSKKYSFMGGGIDYYNEKTLSLLKTSDGNYAFVHGFHWSSDIIKVDTAGNLLFAHAIQMAPVEILESPEGGFVIGGNGPMWGVKTMELLEPQIGIIKMDSLGFSDNCVWETYNSSPVLSPLTDSAVSISVSPALAAASGKATITAQDLNYAPGCVDQGSGTSTPVESFLLFPNPTESSIEVTTPAQMKSYQLYDALGRLLLESPITNTSFTINLENFSNGLYILSINDGSKFYLNKVVKAGQ